MATYTSEQLTHYFRHINYLRKRHTRPDTLRLLADLQKHHVARVPVETLGLHYLLPARPLSLDAEDLFVKIVGHGRGGYSLEVNTFFAAVLRSLGFEVYSTGGRMRHERWNHMVHIVTISGKKYLVDVGFGSKQPIQPIPLEPDGYECMGIVPTRCRLRLQPLSPQPCSSTTTTTPTDPSPHHHWVYATRSDDRSPWTDLYSFSETPFLPGDFEVLHHFATTRPQSALVQHVAAYRAVMDDDTWALAGELVLHGDYVQRTVPGGETVVVERLQTEAQRVQALETYFFIALTEREVRGIRGLASELKGP